MTETTNMQLVDWLDDLTVRFLLNLPASELSSVPRLCFQVEEAQWFYEDFVRPASAAAGNPLPSLTLRQFCLLLFQHCPLLSGFTGAQHIAAYEEFLAYKVRVPVRGAILMDWEMDKLVLVKGWKKGANWSFPRGKINKDERDLDCAIREVYEETGFDVRQAGLVPENEDDAKYLDVTMREQHMRLFVFRGVPEDTYFEPKTRKEISKIAWYNVRDLPGFKKNKLGVDDAVQANKFYMVAPFLGQLKRWINQQRRKDAAVSASGMTQPTTEEEGLTEDYHEETPEPVASRDTSDELRRLLSIGGSVQDQHPQLPANVAQQTNLLALLQGGSAIGTNNPLPQIPHEQMNTFTQHGQMTSPPLATNWSTGYEGSTPQFAFSPQRLHPLQQEPQRNTSVPTSGMFGPGSSGYLPGQQSSSTAGPPTHMYRQFQHHGPMMPGMPNFPSSAGHTNGMSLDTLPRQPMPPQHLQHLRQHQPPGANIPQGPQGAIGSGPAIPKAEHLPKPRLNAHSMDLLHAFRAGAKPSALPSASAGPIPTQANVHQNALLDLFRKPAVEPSPPLNQAQNFEPSSPTGTDVTVKPSSLLERRPTKNEITRTLPKVSKAKSAIDVVPSPIPLAPTPSPLPRPAAEHPKSHQKNDQTSAGPFNSASAGLPKPEPEAPSAQFTILQRSSSRQTLDKGQVQPPKPKQPKISSSSKRQKAAKGAENGAPSPQFTILTRPGSSKASQSPALQVPSSPLPSKSPTIGSGAESFKPQVLRRPDTDHTPSLTPLNTATAAGLPAANNDVEEKRDQLLALFGKTSTGASSPSPSTVARPNQPSQQFVPPNSARIEQGRPSRLINVFTTSPDVATAPTPPPAPTIAPERRPSHQNANREQTALLDLFNKSTSNLVNNNLTSPGTPISPFALGTPVGKHTPSFPLHAQLASRSGISTASPASPSVVQSSEHGPRLNSVASTGKPASGASTPTEASKGFLLDYLNGVVQKEGQKRGKMT